MCPSTNKNRRTGAAREREREQNARFFCQQDGSKTDATNTLMGRAVKQGCRHPLDRRKPGREHVETMEVRKRSSAGSCTSQRGGGNETFTECIF